MHAPDINFPDINHHMCQILCCWRRLQNITVFLWWIVRCWIDRVMNRPCDEPTVLNRPVMKRPVMKRPATSVAIYVRCCGMSTWRCRANFLLSLAVKKNFNRLRFDKVTAHSLVASFFGTQCISNQHPGKLCPLSCQLMSKILSMHNNKFY